MAQDDGARQGMWNDRYRSEGLIYGAEPNQFVAGALTDLPPGRALDLACGQGRNAVWLAQQRHEVTAVDYSEVALDHATALAEAVGVEVDFVHADLMTWSPPTAAFDLVLLSYLHLPAAARAAVHRTAVDSLAPGGTLFLVAHHRDNLEGGVGGPQDPSVLYDEAQLAADFADLVVERNERVLRHVVKEDVEGDAIDVLVLARKPKTR
jgi:SAM-dependent methyltransferase